MNATRPMTTTDIEHLRAIGISHVVIAIACTDRYKRREIVSCHRSHEGAWIKATQSRDFGSRDLTTIERAIESAAYEWPLTRQIGEPT